MSAATLTRFVAMPDTPEWYASRSTGIGASEAAAACGVGNYATPLHVYLWKRGELAPPDETDLMWWGKALEPVGRLAFTRQTGIEIAQAPCPMQRHPEHHFMLATPDAELVDDTLLEIKTKDQWSEKLLGEDCTDDVPEEIAMQCWQQMAVTGKDFCHVATIVGRKLRRHFVRRNDANIRRIIELERELWERIQNGDRPPPQWGHPKTNELIDAMHGNVEVGKTIILPAEYAKIFQRKQRLSKLEARCKALAKDERAKLMHAMGDAAIAIFEAGQDGKPIELQLAKSKTENSGYTVEPFSYFTIRETKPKRKK